MSIQSSKICGICGQDCSKKPRTKDPSGRYFCQACYDTARAKQAGGLTGNRPAPNVAATIADPGMANDELFADLVNAPPVAERLCPGCGAPLAPNAVLCVHCGTSLSGNQVGRLETTFRPALMTPRKSIWPIPVGIVSIVFAVGSILGQLLMFAADGAGPAMNSGDAAYAAGQTTGRAIGMTIVIGFASLLGFGGLFVLLRNPRGVTLLKTWAAIKAILTSIVCMCLVGLIIGFSRSLPDALKELPLPEGGLAFMAVAILLFWAWSMAWPVFLIVWFRRDRVRREVDSW